MEVILIFVVLFAFGIGVYLFDRNRTIENKKECEAYIRGNLEIYNAEPLFYNTMMKVFEEVPPCNKCGNEVMELWTFDYNTLECRCGACKKKFNITDKVSDDLMDDLTLKVQNLYVLMNKINYLFEKNSGSRGSGWEELKSNLKIDYTKLKANTPYIRAMLFEAKGTEIKEELTYITPSRRITQKVKDMVWRRDAGKCVDCGSNEKLEFDHIIPHSKGGANTYRNIQLLCEPCNRKKSNAIG